MMASQHILVIDDEPALRQILAAALRKAGYFVDTAAGVVEAAAKLAWERTTAFFRKHLA